MKEPWYSIREFVVPMTMYILAFLATLAFGALVDLAVSLFKGHG